MKGDNYDRGDTSHPCPQFSGTSIDIYIHTYIYICKIGKYTQWSTEKKSHEAKLKPHEGLLPRAHPVSTVFCLCCCCCCLFWFFFFFFFLLSFLSVTPQPQTAVSPSGFSCTPKMVSFFTSNPIWGLSRGYDRLHCYENHKIHAHTHTKKKKKSQYGY